MYSAELKTPDATKVPKPVGYHLLVAIPSVLEKTKGGILRPDMLRKQEETASIVGRVIEKGPDAYSDKARYPSGPWCEVGDFVLFRSYSGTRIRVDGQEFRLINDDTVEGVVEDPTGFERGF